MITQALQALHDNSYNAIAVRMQIAGSFSKLRSIIWTPHKWQLPTQPSTLESVHTISSLYKMTMKRHILAQAIEDWYSQTKWHYTHSESEEACMHISHSQDIYMYKTLYHLDRTSLSKPMNWIKFTRITNFTRGNVLPAGSNNRIMTAAISARIAAAIINLDKLVSSGHSVIKSD